MATDLFIGGCVTLADEDQFGRYLAFAGLAKPEPASPPSEMKDAVVAGGEIEPHDSLGPVDALRQAGHCLFQRLEGPGHVTMIGPGLEAPFGSVLVMSQRVAARCSMTQLFHSSPQMIVEDQLQRDDAIGGFPDAGARGDGFDTRPQLRKLAPCDEIGLVNDNDVGCRDL